MSVLRGTISFYNFEGSDQVAFNVKTWLEYGLLEISAYTNTSRIGTGSGYSILKRTQDERFGGQGRVYEGLGPSWVWESGVVPIQGGVSPIQVSGVYVNGSFNPINTSGIYSHVVDYERGRIIFDTALSGSPIVQCEYSLRDVGVYFTDSPQWRTIVDSYVGNYDNLDVLSPSGMAEILKENRVWLPSIFVDVQDRTNKALQLGGGELAEYVVFYHVFADKGFTNKRIADLLNNQETKVLTLFDINKAPFPLNFNGSIASGALTYPQVSNRDGPYFWTYGRIAASTGGPVDNLYNVYRSEIRQTIEVERHLSTY